MCKCYTKELAASLALYAVLLFGSIILLQHATLASPWRDTIALSPMLAFPAIFWAVLRQLRSLDELQLRIELEGLAFAFAGTAMLSFGYGFLEGTDWPRQSMFWILPLMVVLRFIGLQLARRRYA
jgi:hypothetical protein